MDGLLGTKFAFNRVCRLGSLAGHELDAVPIRLQFNGTQGLLSPAECAALLKSPKDVKQRLVPFLSNTSDDYKIHRVISITTTMSFGY